MVFASRLYLQGSKGSCSGHGGALAVESRDTLRSAGSVQGVGMIGAIAGDIIGSVYEFRPIKMKNFPLFSPFCDFTDDTVLTVAVAEAILTGLPRTPSLSTPDKSPSRNVSQLPNASHRYVAIFVLLPSKGSRVTEISN
jgi:hypothetical protein